MLSTKQIKANECEKDQSKDALETKSGCFSDSVQCKFATAKVSQLEVGLSNEVALSSTNKTGIPDRLKSGLENLSGYDLSSVRVHYNSAKPKQLGALSYAQGTNIHLGANQEKHLPHEGWHVVQQMQGRVKPTLQLKSHLINDQESLEREADLMGAKADSQYPVSSAINKTEDTSNALNEVASMSGSYSVGKGTKKAIAQRKTVKQLVRIKSNQKAKPKRNSIPLRRVKPKNMMYERLKFDTEFLHPWKGDWPITNTLRTVHDFISHLQKPRSREKFSPQELIKIDEMLAKVLQIQVEKNECLIKLEGYPRSLAPESLPDWVARMTGVPNKSVFMNDLRKRMKKYFTVKLEHLLDKFFKANQDIVSKIAWSIPRIDNPFKATPNLQNVQQANNWNSAPTAYQKSNIQPLTNAAGCSYIKFNKLTKTSSPTNLNDQDKWEKSGILKDKNIPNQRLTLMHQIRGRFGGPSEQANMFLGTAASNLSHERSHVNEVEDRIAWAITSAPKWGVNDFYVEYQVEPQFGNVAQHVMDRIDNSLVGSDRTDAIKWCRQAAPKKYKTHWILHVLLSNGYEGTYEESKTLNADE